MIIKSVIAALSAVVLCTCAWPAEIRFTNGEGSYFANAALHDLGGDVFGELHLSDIEPFVASYCTADTWASASFSAFEQHQFTSSATQLPPDPLTLQWNRGWGLNSTSDQVTLYFTASVSASAAVMGSSPDWESSRTIAKCSLDNECAFTVTGSPIAVTIIGSITGNLGQRDDGSVNGYRAWTSIGGNGTIVDISMPDAGSFCREIVLQPGGYHFGFSLATDNFRLTDIGTEAQSGTLVVAATFHTVPEPATLAIFAIGALATPRRRSLRMH